LSKVLFAPTLRPPQSEALWGKEVVTQRSLLQLSCPQAGAPAKRSFVGRRSRSGAVRKIRGAKRTGIMSEAQLAATWCRRWDSNPHDSRPGILSPVRWLSTSQGPAVPKGKKVGVQKAGPAYQIPSVPKPFPGTPGRPKPGKALGGKGAAAQWGALSGFYPEARVTQLAATYRPRRQAAKRCSEQIALKARACKRLADANVPFGGKGGATERCEKSPIHKANGGL